jgi:hypothetical protein
MVDRRWYWHWDPRFIDRERTEVVANRFAGLLDVTMNNIGVPTMLVRGLESDVLAQEGVDNIVACLEGIKVVEVPGAGHMIAGDQNDAFTGAVSSFPSTQVRPLLPEAKVEFSKGWRVAGLAVMHQRRTISFRLKKLGVRD